MEHCIVQILKCKIDPKSPESLCVGLWLDNHRPINKQYLMCLIHIFLLYAVAVRSQLNKWKLFKSGILQDSAHHSLRKLNVRIWRSVCVFIPFLLFNWPCERIVRWRKVRASGLCVVGWPVDDEVGAAGLWTDFCVEDSGQWRSPDMTLWSASSEGLTPLC